MEKQLNKFNLITRELYDMARITIAWYDDMIAFGAGKYLTDQDVKTNRLAEEIIELWNLQNAQ